LPPPREDDGQNCLVVEIVVEIVVIISRARKAETTKSVIYVSLSLSLFPRVVDDAKTKSTLHKSPQSLAFFLLRCSRVRDERRGNNKPKKRKNTESREIREIFANGHMCRRDANEKRQHVSRKKAKQKNFSRFFSLSLSRVLSRPLLRLGEDTNLI
jgi:hypothetical protein